MVHYSIKNIVKILLVFVFAFFIGHIFYKKDILVRATIDDLVGKYHNYTKQDDSTDLQDFFANVDENGGEDVFSGNALTSGNIVLSGSQSSGDISMIDLLEKRLNYYRASKQELGM